MSGDLLRLLPELAGDHRRGGTGDRCRPGGIGSQPVGGVVGVTLDHLDVGGRYAQLLGDDLGESGLVTLALGADPELEDGLPGGMDPQLRRVEHAEPEDVVVVAVTGSHHLGEGGDADADQSALLPGPLLLLLDLVVPDHLHGKLQGRLVVAGVVDESGG